LFRQCHACSASSALCQLAGLPAGERWSPALHRLHPPAFKSAARFLLLASHRDTPVPSKQGHKRRQGQKASKSAQGTGWQSLPHDVVLQILALSGSDIASWAAVGGA